MSVRIDARGQLCPEPVIALAGAFRDLSIVDVELLTDDPAAEHDVPAWCRLRGFHLASNEPMDQGRCFRITRPEAPTTP